MFGQDDSECLNTIRVNLGVDSMKQSDPNPMKNGAAKDVQKQENVKNNEASTLKSNTNSGVLNSCNKGPSEKLIEDSESDVEDVYDKTSIFMASNKKKSGSGADAILLVWKLHNTYPVVSKTKQSSESFKVWEDVEDQLEPMWGAIGFC
uniref:Uncharacterized protein n=1 Tax=Tanacetum cinerariifolium TaxID=118510 RepID=A0A6L2LKR3_TANCI|nr:hypothetical protein [Tanacetum cinerariifolium]